MKQTVFRNCSLTLYELAFFTVHMYTANPVHPLPYDSCLPLMFL